MVMQLAAYMPSSAVGLVPKLLGQMTATLTAGKLLYVAIAFCFVCSNAIIAET